MKYKQFDIVFNSDIQPKGIFDGFTSFCEDNYIAFNIVSPKDQIIVAKDTLYLTLDDATLITIVKQAKQNQFQIAKDIGIIAYNDSPLKEIIADGITSISTDFFEMGKTLAEIILLGKKRIVENKISVTLRNSI